MIKSFNALKTLLDLYGHLVITEVVLPINSSGIPKLGYLVVSIRLDYLLHCAYIPGVAGLTTKNHSQKIRHNTIRCIVGPGFLPLKPVHIICSTGI
ncbi:MAG: hypothetical protein R2759_06395 [Bacteroidales bacterium]